MSFVPERRSSLGWVSSIFLLVLSILLLPASVLALFYNYAALVLRQQNGLRRLVQRSSRFRRRKVLITGIATPAGLRVARALYHTGYTVIAVDEGVYRILSPARWSKAISKFYSLKSPRGSTSDSRYAEDLFRILVRERAGLWIDCSIGESRKTHALVKRTVEARSTCVCLVPTLEQIWQLESRHDFQQLAQQLGLPNLELYTVRSRNDIYNVLRDSNGKRYLLTESNSTTEAQTHTVLPCRTVNQTYHDVSRLKLSKGTPWTMEQYMGDLPHFTACAIVVRGELKAFSASSLSTTGDHQAISAASGLYEAMKQYLQTFATAIGPKFSSHLTVQFSLEERSTHAGVVQQILPIRGSTTPHENLLLFDGSRGAIELTKAYMTAFSTTTTELESYTGLPYDTVSNTEVVVTPESDIGVYGIASDLQKLVVEPVLRLLILRESILSVVRSCVAFLQHLVAWQEALYEFGDPLPLFWYAHVFMPYYFICEVVQAVWSRTNRALRRRAHERSGKAGIVNGK